MSSQPEGIRKQLSYLFQRFSPVSNLAVLCGAGISVPAPSNLPTALQLIRSYLTSLRASLAEDKPLLELIPDEKTTVQGVRFESVVSIFERIGERPAALSPLQASFNTNENHNHLADLYASGACILTTNFDVLLELAILESGGQLAQAVTPEDYRAIQADDRAVYKLHGSFWKWQNSRWVDASDSIVATLNALGLQYSAYSSNAPQRLRLVTVLRERPLIVLGYSGTDDFDIAPVVIGADRRKPLLWVQHVSGEKEWVVATSNEEIPDEYLTLLPEGLFDRAIQRDVAVVFADTMELLGFFVDEALGARDRAPKRRVDVETPPPSEEEPGFLRSPVNACWFLGLLNQALGRHELALQALAQARKQAAREGLEIAAASSVYEMARTESTARHPVEALRHAEEARVLAKKLDVPELESAALLLIGSLVLDYSLSNLDQAKAVLEAAFKVAERIDRPLLAGLIVREISSCLRRQGKISDAYTALLHAYELVERSGDLEELLLCRHRLAICALELGEVDRARALLKDARELSEALGDIAYQAANSHENGVLEQMRGNLEAAKDHFSQALITANRIGDRKSAAITKTHLGWIAFQQGDPATADVYERESSEVLEDDHYYLAHNLQLRAVLKLVRGSIDAGKALLQEAIALSRETGDSINVANCSRILEGVTALDPSDDVPLRLMALLVPTEGQTSRR